MGLRMMDDRPDFIQEYIQYVGKSESPTVFHRWSAIGGLGAWLGKSVWFEHGSFKIYPNMYIQLFGVPGTRKSTAIKRFAGLLRKAGYRNFAAEKTSKEKFIEWMASRAEVEEDAELWGSLVSDGSSTDTLIAADEFNDFFGANILDFMSFLGVMWDYDGDYEFSTRSMGSVTISNPCISILSGNTPTTLAHTIPPEAIGQGFFSRIIIVHGEETRIRIAFPEKPAEENTEYLVRKLGEIQATLSGPISMTDEGLALCEKIYNTWQRVDDPRFDGYGNRRFSQLLKLCIIHCAADYATEITAVHVRRANTVLTRIEKDMPKALGEFGTSRNTVAITRVLKLLGAATKPMSAIEIWSKVHNDLDKIGTLSEILMGLLEANKIQRVGEGMLLNRQVKELVGNNTDMLDWDYLTAQEKVLTQ